MLINKYNNYKIENLKDIGSIMVEIVNSRQKTEKHKEYDYVIGLDTNDTIKYIDIVGIGSSFQVLSSTREVFKLALSKNIFSIIFAHNHPNQTLGFSNADKKEYNKLKEICNYLEINLLDFLVITNNSYISIENRHSYLSYNSKVIGYGI